MGAINLGQIELCKLRLVYVIKPTNADAFSAALLIAITGFANAECQSK